MAGRRFWATMAVASILSFMAGCAVGAHLEDDYIAIDKTGLDRQSKYCAEQVEQAYNQLYRQQQVECSADARRALCPTGDINCQQEAVTFCRIAIKLQLLHLLGECLETPHFRYHDDTFI